MLLMVQVIERDLQIQEREKLCVQLKVNSRHTENVQ